MLRIVCLHVYHNLKWHILWILKIFKNSRIFAISRIFANCKIGINFIFFYYRQVFYFIFAFWKLSQTSAFTHSEIRWVVWYFLNILLQQFINTLNFNVSTMRCHCKIEKKVTIRCACVAEIIVLIRNLRTFEPILTTIQICQNAREKNAPQSIYHRLCFNCSKSIIPQTPYDIGASQSVCYLSKRQVYATPIRPPEASVWCIAIRPSSFVRKFPAVTSLRPQSEFVVMFVTVWLC